MVKLNKQFSEPNSDDNSVAGSLINKRQRQNKPAEVGDRMNNFNENANANGKAKDTNKRQARNARPARDINPDSSVDEVETMLFEFKLTDFLLIRIDILEPLPH